LAVLDEGPGDKCLAWKHKLAKDALSVSQNLWFYRRDIAVAIQCSEERNLIPLGKAIDQRLAACSTADLDTLLSRLPEVEVGQLNPVEKGQYRASFKASGGYDPKTHEVVALGVPSYECIVSIGDKHIEVTMVKGAEKGDIQVGVLDRKSLLVRWARGIEVAHQRPGVSRDKK